MKTATLRDSHRVLILLCSNEVRSESSKWTNSNSPCGASEEEEEVTLWVNAHGKQDFLFVCYGVMGRGGFVHYIFHLNIYIFSESAHQTHSTEDVILVYFQIFLRVREV